jgi:endo-1,4-beta-mannosidase
VRRRHRRLLLAQPFLILLAALITCTPAKKVTAQKLLPVRVDGAYFIRGDKRFIPLGAHWVPAKAAMEWPIKWDITEVEADFAKMHELGFSLVRIDMLWAWFEPRPSTYNKIAFEQLDELIRLAHKYELYLHPSLFIGGEVGEAYWDVPWRNGRNPHTDPEMLRLETNLAAEFGRRYAEETAILAWDITDEPPFWITTGITDAQAASWTQAVVAGLRGSDRLHPIVVGTAGQEVSHGPFRSDILQKNKDVSFFSVHPFTIYHPDLFPDAMLSERSTYGAAFEVALSSGAGKPAMIHEMGASTAQYAPEKIALYERASLYEGLATGSIGVNLWCFTDAAPEQRKKLPYVRTPQETEWGLTTWDRKDKPRGREFRALSKVIAQLDLTSLTPAPADAAVIVPEEWSKPFGDLATRFGLTGREPLPYVSTEDTINGLGGAATMTKLESANSWLMGALLSSFVLGHRAGMKIDFPREQDDATWTKRPIVILPSPLTATSTPFLTHVHSDFYDRALKYVDDGGFLYASVAADAAVPAMDTLFGAHLSDTNTSSEITIKVEKAYGALEPGMTFDVKPPAANARSWGALLESAADATVIARDQDGHPVLVANKRGKGKTLLSAFPLESHLAVTPSAFDRKAYKEKPQLPDLLYRSILKESGHTPLFITNDPAVSATTLTDGARGYTFVINHSPDPKKVSVTPKQPPTSATRVGGGDTLGGARWDLDLPPWDARVVSWR